MLKPIALALALTTPSIAAAQQAEAPQASVSAAPALKARIGELIAILKDEGDYDTYFAPTFREKVPQSQFSAVTKKIVSAIGAPTAIEQITPESPYAASLRIGFEKGIATARIVVSPNAPHQVNGLLITGTEPRSDSISALDDAFQSLPGKAGFGIYALKDDGPVSVAQYRGDQTAPLGSSFKLWLLAEAARQVTTGTRKWDDIVPLRHTTLASGTLSTWPLGAPMTLQSVATLMISESDNNATDTMLAALGPAKVDAMVTLSGVANADATLPVLNTAQAFALKDPRNAALLAAWIAAETPQARRKVLATHRDVMAKPVSPDIFAGKPVAIDSVEWFASPRDEAATLDWLRRNGGDTALAILSVNKGVSKDVADRFDYIGYKGGSEPGVIAANFLLKRKDGRWFAVTGNWHREDAGVDQSKFFGLMNRALLLAAKAE